MMKNLFTKQPAPGWSTEELVDGNSTRVASNTSQAALIDKVFSLFTPEGLVCEELTLGASGVITGYAADRAALATWAVVDCTLQFYNSSRHVAVRFSFALKDRSGSSTYFGRYQLPGASTPAWFYVLREAGAAGLSEEVVSGKSFKYSSWRSVMTLNFTLAPNGFVTGERVNPDEHSWGIEEAGGCLVTRHASGKTSCRYTLSCSGLYGELLLGGAFAIPDTSVGAWHFLSMREEEAQEPATEASNLRGALSGRSFRYENSDRVLAPALTLDPRGFITGFRNISETTWAVDPASFELVFKHANGDTSVRFPVLARGEDGLFTALGPFLLTSKLGILHYLREIVE